MYVLEIIHSSCMCVVQALHNGMLLHVSPQLQVQVDSLKPATVGVFTPLKLANDNDQGSFLRGEPVMKHSSTQSENHLCEEWHVRGEPRWLGKIETWSQQAKATARVICSILILSFA